MFWSKSKYLALAIAITFCLLRQQVNTEAGLRIGQNQHHLRLRNIQGKRES